MTDHTCDAWCTHPTMHRCQMCGTANAHYSPYWDRWLCTTCGPRAWVIFGETHPTKGERA